MWETVVGESKCKNLFKHYGVQHGAQALHNIILHDLVHLLLQMPLGVLFANVLDRQLLGRHFLLVLQRLKKRVINITLINITIHIFSGLKPTLL